MNTKELSVSTANRPLVGTLISIGDVTRNIAIVTNGEDGNGQKINGLEIFKLCLEKKIPKKN